MKINLSITEIDLDCNVGLVALLSENILDNIIIMIIADTIDLSLSLLRAYDSQLHKSRLAKISQKETCNGIASAFTYSWVIARNNDVRKSR